MNGGPSPNWVSGVFAFTLIGFAVLWSAVEGLEQQRRDYPMSAPGGDDVTITPWN